MSTTVAIFPTLRPAPYSAREGCMFDAGSDGYHQQRLAAPGECLLFTPGNPGFYPDWQGTFGVQELVRAELKKPGSNVAAFRPPRPQLRLSYEYGDWQVWAFLPAGQRLPLTPGYPFRAMGEEAMYAMQEALRRETGVRFEVVG